MKWCKETYFYPTHHAGTVGSCSPAPWCGITRRNAFDKMADTTTQQWAVSGVTYPVPVEEGVKREGVEESMRWKGVEGSVRDGRV